MCLLARRRKHHAVWRRPISIKFRNQISLSHHKHAITQAQ
jgi:hypothetical protein